MAKGAGRKTSDKGSASAGELRAVALSPEDAERAAAAFVPLWQLDEAPFLPSSGVTDEDLLALSGPLTASAALQLAHPPVIGPAGSPEAASDAEAPSLMATPDLESAASPEPLPTAPPTILHQPVPAAPPLPLLPSVIVEEGGLKESDSFVSGQPGGGFPVTASLAASVPAPTAASPSSYAATSGALREPKTDPPAARARPAARPPPSPADVTPPAAYQVPRSRVPLMLGGAVVGSAVLILGVYFVSTAMSAPEASSPAPLAAGARPEPATARAAGDVEPALNIPPPAEAVSPSDGAPSARALNTPSLPPAAAPATTTSRATDSVDPTAAPPRNPARAAAAPSPVVAAPSSPAQPPRTASSMPHPPRAPTTKNPSSTPASGGIVRDNPF